MNVEVNSNNLHLIRLESRQIADQLYYMKETLKGLAGEGVSGWQLYPVAIRGLCWQLSALENKATGISSSACRLLGVDECTFEDFA